MNSYPAGRLDARNIGSSVGVDMGEGTTIFGTVTAIHRSPKHVLIYLADNEGALELDHRDEVDVHLTGAALYALHTKSEIERLREEVQEMVDVFRQALLAPAPIVLKAV